jgi:hypothetical protein
MDFYERMASCGSAVTPYTTTYEYVGWPVEPTFACETSAGEASSERCMIAWPNIKENAPLRQNSISIF